MAGALTEAERFQAKTSPRLTGPVLMRQDGSLNRSSNLDCVDEF